MSLETFQKASVELHSLTWEILLFILIELMNHVICEIEIWPFFGDVETENARAKSQGNFSLFWIAIITARIPPFDFTADYNFNGRNFSLKTAQSSLAVTIAYQKLQRVSFKPHSLFRYRRNNFSSKLQWVCRKRQPIVSVSSDHGFIDDSQVVFNYSSLVW